MGEPLASHVLSPEFNFDGAREQARFMLYWSPGLTEASC